MSMLPVRYCGDCVLRCVNIVNIVNMTHHDVSRWCSRMVELPCYDKAAKTVVVVVVVAAHINSQNQVRGHRTGSGNFGVEEYPREQNSPKLVRVYLYT